MPNPERPTLRPPVPRPRAKQTSNHGTEGALSTSERELILQAIHQATAQVKVDLEERLAQSQRAQSVAPKKKTDWGDIATKGVAALALIGTTLAALKPTPKDDRVDKAYEDLAKAVHTIEAQQQRTDGSVDALRAWLAGYLNATGVKTVNPPGAPPAAPVELLPAPLARSPRRGQAEPAPAIQVRTPLPAPPPSVAPIKLAPKLAQ